MAIGSDGTGWIEFDDYELARTVGIVALALILFEGGLTSGLGEIRPVLGTAISLALIGDLDHGGDRRRDGVAAVRLRPRAGPARRRRAREHGRRGDLRAAAQLDPAAAAGAHARGRVGPQRPGRRAARARLHRVDQAARLRVRGHVAAVRRASSGSGSPSALAVGWLGVQAFRRAQLATAGLYPVASLAIAALAFGGADTLHGSGFLAVYLAGLVLGSRRDPGPAHDHRLPRGARVGRPGRRCSSRSACSSSRPSSATSPLEGTVLALVVAVVARPVAIVARDAARALQRARAARARLGRPARRGPGRARDVPGDRRRPGQPRVLQHRLLRGARSRPCCRARRSSRSPRASA